VNHEADPPQGRRVGAILWGGRYIIIASVVIMALLALVYTSSQPEVYQATALIQVNVATNQPASTDTTNTNQALAQNYATLMVSPGLLNSIRGQVDGGKLSTATLQGRLTASALPTSSLVQLQATGPSPDAAQRLAQQVADGFLAQLQSSASKRTAQLQAQDRETISNLSAEIAKLQSQPASVSTTQQLTSLKSSLQALITQNEALVASGLAQGTSATLSAPPVAAPDPISPRRSINVLGGVLLGLVLGVVLVWIRHLVRPEVRSAEDAASEVEWPVLASVPLNSKLRSEDPTALEAYRILSTRLSLPMRERGQKVVTVTGFGPQVGKTSTVKGLGEALAERGNRVLLVDGDMRAASLSSTFGLRDRPGLVDLLQGMPTTIDDAIAHVEGNLYLMPARPSRVNAARLLSGPQTEELLSELRDRFDYILLDTPPIAALADGLILASLSDVVVFVVRAGLTRPADLKAAAQSLAQSRTPVEGMVVFEELTRNLYYPLAEEQGRDGGVGEPAHLTPAGK
jgi:capsular exopolysaccharide synthesis family protein